jgi:hypothetical protein
MKIMRFAPRRDHVASCVTMIILSALTHLLNVFLKSCWMAFDSYLWAYVLTQP